MNFVLNQNRLLEWSLPRVVYRYALCCAKISSLDCDGEIDSWKDYQSTDLGHCWSRALQSHNKRVLPWCSRCFISVRYNKSRYSVLSFQRANLLMKFTESFTAARKWLTELQYHADANIVVLLAGNKNDLVHLRAVSVEEAQQFASTEGEKKVFFSNQVDEQIIGLSTIETSALDSSNVEQAFMDLLTSTYSVICKVRIACRKKTSFYSHMRAHRKKHKTVPRVRDLENSSNSPTLVVSPRRSVALK